MKALKTLATLCLGVMLFVGCTPGGQQGGEDHPSKDGLILSIDKSYIYNNGGATNYGIATFTVTYNGVALDENDYTIFEEVHYEGYIEDVIIEGNTYSYSGEPGNHYFYATYGVEQTKSLTLLMVVETPPAAPEAPADNEPSKYNFKQRALLTQFTGTGCGFCPGMMNALYSTVKNPVYGDKFVLAAAHLYNTDDPAYLSDASSLSDLFGVSGYPTVNGNFYKNNSYSDSEHIIDLIDECLAANPVKGGIAVSSKMHEDKNYIVINANIKACETAEFRVGAWLLEDGISGAQANNGFQPEAGVNFNLHNNCIRVANSRQNYKDFTGLTLGTLKKGECKTQEFAFPLVTNWEYNNLHIVVFITTKVNGKWVVNNAVRVTKEQVRDGVVNFEYAE